MRARLADRLGLTAAGLATPSARTVMAWLDRVRAGGLEPTEAAAALRLVYRLWLVGLLLKAVGSSWDVAWHFRFIRDDFAPPHNINLVGDGLVIALVLFHWYTRFGVDRTALRLMAGGLLVFLASAPIDVINHRINGLDITSWSLTHFGLYTGTGIAIAGAIRGWRRHSTGQPGRAYLLGALWFFFLENVLFPNQQQEYGVESLASWDRGDVYAEAELLQFAADRIGHPVDRAAVIYFSLPVPDWVYPVWLATAGVLTLVLARRSVGLRWAATTVALGYVAWRSVLWPVLWISDFPTSAVPFLLVLAGFAVDAVLLLNLPWLAEAGAGAVTVVGAVYLGAFVQSYVLMAPPISYWSAPYAVLLLFAGWSALPYLSARYRVELF